MPKLSLLCHIFALLLLSFCISTTASGQSQNRRSGHKISSDRPYSFNGSLESGIQGFSFCPKGAETGLSPLLRAGLGVHIPLKRQHSMHVGLSYAYSRMVLKGNTRVEKGFDVLGDEMLRFIKMDDPSIQSVQYSRLNTEWVELTFLYGYQPIPRLSMKAGVRMQVLMGARSDARYKSTGGAAQRIQQKSDFFINRNLVSAEVRIGYAFVEVFGQYGLVSLFQKKYLECGAAVYPMAAGVAFRLPSQQ